MTLSITIDLKATKEFDVVISEPIRKGQRIISGTIEYMADNVWISFEKFNSVDPKRIVRGKKINGNKIRINIENSQAKPAIRYVGVYNAVKPFALENTNYYNGLTYIKSTEAKKDGTWNQNADLLSSNSADSKLTFTFTGSRIWVIGKKDKNYGKMSISIDGKELYSNIQTNDNSAKSDAMLFKTKYLSFGQHTVSVYPSAANNLIDIQGIYYLGMNKGMFEIPHQDYSVVAGQPIKLSVKRFRSAAGKASVYFFTDPNLTVQGKNYIDTKGTLTFEDGENIKEITVDTINHSSQVGKLSFFIKISNPWSNHNFSRITFLDVTKTEISTQGFSHNLFIEELTLSKGVTSIGDSAFDTCTNLRKVHISGDITFGDWVFQKCYSLQEVVYCGLDAPVPGSQDHIFTEDFAGATIEYGDEQVNVFVPSSYKSDHFIEMRFIQTMSNHVETQNHIVEFFSESTNVTGEGDASWNLIESALQSQKCGSSISGNFIFIGKDVNLKSFNDQQAVQSVKFDVSGNLVISEKCFSGCSSLNLIQFPVNIVSLELESFKGTSIKTISIPASCRTIKNSVFSDCKNLETVEINDNVDKMGNFVFHNCLKLVDLSYFGISPPGRLNEGALEIFTYDSTAQLKAETYSHYDANVTVHVQYDYSGDSFAEKSVVKRDLNTFEIDNFIFSISNDTLIIESKLNRSTVDKSLIDQAYAKIPTLGYSTANIRNFVFRGIDMNVSSNGFQDDSRLINVIFENTGESVLLARSFFNCQNLTSITLPSKLINLSNSALKQTSITKITIPSYCHVIEDAS